MHPVTVGRTRISVAVAALVALMTVACVWVGSAAATPALSTPPVQPAVAQQTEEAAEAAEAQEEAAEISAEVVPAFEPRATSKLSASTSRKIGRLTRKIHHLRVVKERIRARRRHLRELPAGSKRRQHGLAVQTAKLLRKRNRLFSIQNERGELEGH
jgi:hypothetical protein